MARIALVAATDAEFLQDGFDPHVAGRNLLVVSIVEGKRLFERKQVLSAVVSGERLLDCFGVGVAAVIPQARQHFGIMFAGEDCADDPQSGCACDIGDDMVELEVHLGQRLLHVLNMRGRILEQTLALTYVGA